jgi:hypothetical protein
VSWERDEFGGQLLAEQVQTPKSSGKGIVESKGILGISSRGGPSNASSRSTVVHIGARGAIVSVIGDAVSVGVSTVDPPKSELVSAFTKEEYNDSSARSGDSTADSADNVISSPSRTKGRPSSHGYGLRLGFSPLSRSLKSPKYSGKSIVPADLGAEPTIVQNGHLTKDASSCVTDANNLDESTGYGFGGAAGHMPLIEMSKLTSSKQSDNYVATDVDLTSSDIDRSTVIGVIDVMRQHSAKIGSPTTTARISTTTDLSSRIPQSVDSVDETFEGPRNEVSNNVPPSYFVAGSTIVETVSAGCEATASQSSNSPLKIEDASLNLLAPGSSFSLKGKQVTSPLRLSQKTLVPTPASISPSPFKDSEIAAAYFSRDDVPFTWACAKCGRKVRQTGVGKFCMYSKTRLLLTVLLA